MSYKSSFVYEDCAIVVPDKLLIVADVHFGYPQSKQHIESIQQRLETLAEKYTVDTIVFNGDTFHEFPFLDQGKDVLRKLSNTYEIILIPGNHEENVGGFGKLGTQYTTTDEYVFSIDSSRIVVTHGHKTPTEPGDAFIIGHAHPETNKKGFLEPCLLYGKNSSYNSDVFVLPSFGQLSSNQSYTQMPDNHVPLINDGDDISTYTVVKTF